MSKRFLLGLVVGLVAALTGCNNATGASTGASESLELSYNYKLLSDIYLYRSELGSRDSYVGKGDADEQYGDVVALYASLTDPFTHYFTPAQAEDIYSRLTSSASGALIGIEMKLVVSADTSAPDTIAVHRVYPGSAAAAAGLRKGDKILMANGVDVTGANVSDRYTQATAGGAGTQVVLTVLRGTETLTFTMVKTELVLPTVFLDSLDGVPVVQITEFTENTSSDSGTTGEFRAILREMAGAKAAVIDLRGNPGGYVDHCLAMSDDLIASGTMIYELMRYRDDNNKVHSDTLKAEATAGGLGEGIEWVFLADGNSASCAEIMLSAVKNRLGSTIVGDTSYGKGVGQFYDWTYAKGIAGITAIEFRDQNWLSYHKVGIAPDYRILNADSALAKAVSLAQEKAGAALTKSAAKVRVSASTRGLSTILGLRRQDAETSLGGAWRWKPRR